MAWKRDEKVECEVSEVFGFLDDKESKCVARVSWNGGPVKTDIRRCYKKDGELMLSSGISLSDDELEHLQDILSEHVKKAVDFDEIFKTSESIAKNRQKGFSTENGFIRLKRKKKNAGD